MNESQILALAKRQMQSRMETASRRITSEAKQRLTAKSGTPSSPGEYPAKQTGKLSESIRHSVKVNADTIEAKIELTADYAEYLAPTRNLMGSVQGEIESEILNILKGK